MSFGGGSGGGSTNASQSYNFARFPGEFVSQAGQVVGQPLSFQELMAGMPQTTGLFGGGGSGSPYAPSYAGTGGASSGIFPAAGPPGSRGGSPYAPAGAVWGGPSPGTSSGIFPQSGPQPGGTPSGSGLTSGSTVTSPNPPKTTVGSVIGYNLLGTPGPNPPNVTLPPAPSMYAPLDPASTAARDRIPQQTDNTGMGLFNQQGLANTNIGGPTPTYANQAQNLFEASYRPVANETQRLGAQQDRSLNSMLANSGLAS
jgi:hypothetical protein